MAGSGHFTVTELCRQFGILRKTGHKWIARHDEEGMKGLEDRSRAPKSVTCRTTHEVERLICTEKRLHSTWGPKKLQQVLRTKHGLESPPAVSTVGEVLKRHGLITERTRRGAVFKVERGALTAPQHPRRLAADHRQLPGQRRDLHHPDQPDDPLTWSAQPMPPPTLDHRKSPLCDDNYSYPLTTIKITH